MSEQREPKIGLGGALAGVSVYPPVSRNYRCILLPDYGPTVLSPRNPHPAAPRKWATSPKFNGGLGWTSRQWKRSRIGQVRRLWRERLASTLATWKSALLSGIPIPATVTPRNELPKDHPAYTSSEGLYFHVGADVSDSLNAFKGGGDAE